MARPKAEINRSKVRELYEQGYGYQRIARELECSEWAVRMFIQEAGFKNPQKYKRCSAKKLEEIKHLYLDEGLKISEVAERLGFTYEDVKSILNRKGIARKKRKPGEWRKEDDLKFARVKLVTIEDPVFYVPRKPTNEKLTYHKKKYRDVSAVYLGE